MDEVKKHPFGHPERSPFLQICSNTNMTNNTAVIFTAVLLHHKIYILLFLGFLQLKLAYEHTAQYQYRADGGLRGHGLF